MMDQCCRHLPAGENEKFIAILSPGGVVNRTLTIGDRTIRQLGDSISGSDPS